MICAQVVETSRGWPEFLQCDQPHFPDKCNVSKVRAHVSSQATSGCTRTHFGPQAGSRAGILLMRNTIPSKPKKKSKKKHNTLNVKELFMHQRLKIWGQRQ